LPEPSKGPAEAREADPPPHRVVQVPTNQTEDSGTEIHSIPRVRRVKNPVESPEPRARREELRPMAMPHAETHQKTPVAVETPDKPAAAAMPEAAAGTALEPARPVEKPTALTEINMVLEGREPKAGNVALRVVQRGEEVHVAVRTADRELSRDLRAHLDGLAERLESAGYRSEMWRPQETVAAEPLSIRSSGSHHRQAGGHNHNHGGERQQQPGGEQRRRQPDPPRWLSELEAQTRREKR